MKENHDRPENDQNVSRGTSNSRNLRSRRHLSNEENLGNPTEKQKASNGPTPPRTLYRLAQRAHEPRALLSTVMADYNLPDLRPALGDFFVLGQTDEQRRGIRRSASDCALPFECLTVWHSFRVQLHDVQNPDVLLPPYTIKAHPPTNVHPFGRYDTVLAVDTTEAQTAGIEGESPLFKRACEPSPTTHLQGTKLRRSV